MKCGSSATEVEQKERFLLTWRDEGEPSRAVEILREKALRRVLKVGLRNSEMGRKGRNVQPRGRSNDFRKD